MTEAWSGLVAPINAVGPWVAGLDAPEIGAEVRTLLGTTHPVALSWIDSASPSDPSRPDDSRSVRARAMSAFRVALARRGPVGTDRVFGLAAVRVGPAIHLAIQTDGTTLARTFAAPIDGLETSGPSLATQAALDLIATALGLDVRGIFGHRPQHEARADFEECRHPGLVDLLTGRRDRVTYDLQGPDRFEPVDNEGSGLIFPGSFRPFHDGHAAMAEAAARWAGRPCELEISLFHPEKPPLDYVAIASRLRGLGNAVRRLSLTNAPTYVEKARLSPGATFVVGHDTAERILDPRFYGGIEGRDAMLAELEVLGTQFLVFGRIDATGRFRDAINAPEVRDFLTRRMTVVPEAEFRVDLSSTAIRTLTGDDLD